MTKILILIGEYDKLGVKGIRGSRGYGSSGKINLKAVSGVG